MTEILSDRDAQFNQILRQWRGYLRRMSERFSKPPDFLPDDAYQVASLVIWEVFQGVNPEEKPVDFQKIVKTYVPRRLGDEIRKLKTAGRNVEATIHESDTETLDPSIQDAIPDGMSILDLSIDKPHVPSPEDDAVWADIRDHIQRSCTEDEKLLVSEILDPSKRTLDLFLAHPYRSRPSSIPSYILMQSLEWDPPRYARTVAALRIKLKSLLCDGGDR